MAAGSTYTPIATTTLGSNAANITFSSIPATYTDLVVILNGAFTTAETIGVQFNSDTGSNYSSTILAGSGSSVSSGRNSNQTGLSVGTNGYWTTTIISNSILNIQNYSNTTTYKTMLSRSNNSSVGLDAIVGLWRSTAAINAIKLYGLYSGHSFITGTTATLYGIAAA
ncbi:hypothetical protein EB001_23905 [bacterium]|nr:hypothetical protein [bacterium]